MNAGGGREGRQRVGSLEVMYGERKVATTGVHGHRHALSQNEMVKKGSTEVQMDPVPR